MKEDVPFTCSKLIPVSRCYASAWYMGLLRKAIQVVVVVRNFVIELE